MTRDELKAVLRQSYERQPWMDAARGWLPAVEWFAKPQVLPDRPEGVEDICQLGKAVLADGRALALLEVRLGNGKDLLRNRVGLRKLIVKYIDQQVSHGVIAVFVSEHDEYRLTLAVRESVIGDDGEFAQRETAPRRYTFVLGPDEPCTTAAGRLHALADKAKAATLADVVEAFSVERLNKEFFKRYKEHYQRFVQFLVACDIPQRIFDIAQADDADGYERALKPVRDFAKKLLGRLVFLHFLQKKGWLGCSANTNDWTGGDPDFLLNLFKTAPKPDRFYSERLVPLFFNALNRSNRVGDLFVPTGTRVPYLNGGLFEEELPASRQLDFPADLFASLLDFFGEYNFTIDENDPEDHEVGIDPEMLGHVFENLLEDNKDKGAYYTPKAIVQYMCQQSLIRYLRTHLGAHDEIDRLVQDKDRGEENSKRNWVQQNAKEIERLLDEVKICDPAIGSGAFPIGLLQEIYWIKLALDWTLDRAKTKRRIIQNSVYGVDIDAGAVEIARLRFWLALIVEEEAPSPLPNLDYKIMQGDSLLESFEGIPLDHLFSHDYSVKVFAGQGALDLNSSGTQLTLVEKHKENLVKLTGQYYAEADPVAKLALHKQIDALVLTHIDDSIQEQSQRVELELAHHRDEIAVKKRKVKGWKPSARTAKRVQVLEKELQLCAERGDKLKALQGKQERPFFLWHVYFQDVFERGGFDIVIANPPYVSALEYSKIYGAQKRALLNQAYASATGAYDLFVLFMEKSLKLLKDTGVSCLITPNKYLSADYAESLRRIFLSEAALLRVTDASRVRVFRTASVYPVITLFSRSSAEAVHLAYAAQGLQDDQIVFKKRGLVAKQELEGIAGANWGFLISEHFDQVQSFLKGTVRLEEIAKINATTTAAEADAYGKLLTENKKAKCKVVNTGTIDCFRSLWGSRGLRHQGAEFMCPALDLKSPIISDRRRLLYRSPKIIFAKIGKSCEAFFDNAGDYAGLNVNCVHSPSSSWSLSALTAYLNSAPFSIAYGILFGSLRMSGGYLQFQSPQMRTMPVPGADAASVKKLEELEERARVADGDELEEINAEVDELVFGLFSISEPDAVRLSSPEFFGARSTDVKSELVDVVLPALLQSSDYISLEQVAAELERLQLEVEHETLRSYLSEAMGAGVIHDAGRGWYSRLSQALELDAKPIAPLVRLVGKAFPLLDFSCWSTAQINPWTQHMQATHTVFLYAEADALPSLAERLDERGWKVYANPTPSEAESGFRPGDKTVVLRPALSKQPEGEDHAAPAEKVLVDLVAEASRLRLMDTAEAQRVVTYAAQAGRVQVAALLAYARRRRVDILYFSQPTNSTSSENVELMD